MTEVSESFGAYGGRYVPETLIPALDELTEAWETARRDPAFQSELEELGRPDAAERELEHAAAA